jgi:hypothetical protein
MEPTKTKLTPAACPTCGKVLDSAMCLTTENTPSPGDLSVCIQCLALLQFTENLGLDLCDEATLDDPEALAEVAKIRAAITHVRKQQTQRQRATVEVVDVSAKSMPEDLQETQRRLLADYFMPLCDCLDHAMKAGHKMEHLTGVIVPDVPHPDDEDKKATICCVVPRTKFHQHFSLEGMPFKELVEKALAKQDIPPLFRIVIIGPDYAVSAVTHIPDITAKGGSA